MVWIVFNKNINLYNKNSYKIKNHLITICSISYSHIILFKWVYLKLNCSSILVNKYFNLNLLFNIMYFCKIINIKYIGKIFKIKKFSKILILTFNYPIFKYLIWKNIKLKWQKKPKRLIYFYLNTYSNIPRLFWYNLIFLRPLNTYTTRGIYNNIFLYNKRKKKATNKR